MPGGGVAGAIHRAAAPSLAEECRPLAPIRPGECAISGGYGLPHPWVTHCLEPVFAVLEPALGAVIEAAPHLQRVKRLRFVLFGSRAADPPR